MSCHRTITVNADGFCRLCWRQSVGERPHGTGLSILEANRHGQQLYFADLFRQRRSTPAPPATPRRRHREYPVLHRQLSLVDLTRDIARGQRRGFQDPPDPEFARLLDLAAHEHASAHGWSKTRLNDARKGIRILLSIQDTAGSVIRTTEVSQLEQISLAVQPVLDVLESAGLLDSDRKPALLAWFDRQTESLPGLMRDEVRVWFDVLRLGSTTPPRCRPRAEPTIRLRIRYALPALQAWAADGHTSLREITRDQVKTALPDQGSDRSLVGQALRSLFRLLKARRMIFTNPTTHIRTGRPETRTPMPLRVAALQQALNSNDAAQAVIAASATGGDVRRLCDLFGISVKAAERYAHALGHPKVTGTSHTNPAEVCR
ncbi:hypothetical protein SAMN05661093_02031 [Kibdelosporangium aridum]|uniref:Uncharacterized protein n=1 Tax=Kibdelosporangium aridum TaxID=2030 RepID=A0A1W2CJ00_KIBAR|nr:hypothetical protein SAMN05661093_02031 [Kibdelosporangium aridum]